MDAYTLGIILRQLLSSAGLKNTLAIVAVLGFFYGIFRLVRGGLDFLERLLVSRDAQNQAFTARLEKMLDTTMTRVTEQDKARTAFENGQGRILEKIAMRLDEGLEAQKRQNDAMHDRFDKVDGDHQKMSERLAEIKGGLSA